MKDVLSWSCACTYRTSAITIQGVLGALLTSSIFLGALQKCVAGTPCM